MCLACHLQILTESKIVFINNHQQISNPKDESVVVQSFSHPNFRSFTLFHVINQNNHNSLFVVSKNNTIIELELESMKMIGQYPHSSCLYSSMSDCEETIFINQLSDIILLNQKMLWLCYIEPHLLPSPPSLANCLIPKNKIFDTDIKWQKAGYTSTSNHHKTYSIQTKDNIFIGSFFDGSLHIMRSKLPSILGKIDSSKDLITPMANFYFEKNSQFLEVFETDFEVYFVVVEPVSPKSHTISDCHLSSDSRIVFVTRLVRICKKDAGGVKEHNEYNFGTTAKANLICPVGSGNDEFVYMKAVSASWANSKLYVLFENQKNSPSGKVLCYFDVFAFNVVFDGQIRTPWIFSSPHRIDGILKNPLPRVCQLLDNGNLSKAEKTIASSLSVNGLYRKSNIQPITKGPMLHLRNKEITIIKTISMGLLDSSTILIFTDNNFIEIYRHSENNELCDISKYQLNEQELVYQISGFNLDFNLFVLISTNQRMIKLKVNNCEQYITADRCLKLAPSICGWDHRMMICTSLNDQVDIKKWKRSSCRHHIKNKMWSSPQVCQINDSQISLKCICNYCIDEIMCKSKPKVQITNCSGEIEIGSWGKWEKWSECNKKTGLSKRIRKCLTKIECVGKNEEYQHCLSSEKGFITAWTQWISISNTNLYNSYRAKCQVDNLTITPKLETREMFCENSCPDNSFKWSKWSECVTQQVQYRIYNCTTISQCPSNKIQLQNCESTLRKSSNNQNESETSYSTIHLVLAVIIASIIWVFILISISIILLKFKLKTQIVSKRKRRARMHTYQPTKIHFNRQFSETSNDYLSSDIKSTTNDTDHPNFSFHHIENIASTSKNPYLPFQVTKDQCSSTLPS